MNLHENRKLFLDAVLAASQYLKIKPIFVEKDYWITRSLKLMCYSDTEERAIFKGGTSLSKAHFIGFRFSEDIDIAIVNGETLNGNQRKMLIRRLAKSATVGLDEIPTPGVTSKGSNYYKAIYGYEQLEELMNPNVDIPVRLGKIMLEINSFANPYPYVKCSIGSFIGDFLEAIGNSKMIDDYGLEGFYINVLDKRRTATEKIVSLLRFSLAKDSLVELSKKIRHFYDLHFLMNDSDCLEYFQSSDFIADLNSLLIHDRDKFRDPRGWNGRPLLDSVLLTSLDGIWNTKLSSLYKRELSVLAYRPIPTTLSILKSVAAIMEIVKSSGLR